MPETHNKNNNQHLAGRVALVTGSAKRIGRAIALELAARGAAVVINARTDRKNGEDTVAEVQRRGGQASLCLADITAPEEAQRLINHALAAFGRLDILVNNAAVRRPVKLADMTFKEWRDIMAVVLDGAFLCAHAAYPHLAKGGVGRIVNIAGVTAHVGARDRVHVTSAKAGLLGMTKSLALDLGSLGITVNAVSPGVIEDPNDDAVSTMFRRNQHPPETIPAGRTGVPQDIAGVIANICGDDFAYVTGQTIHVNGGIYLC